MGKWMARLKEKNAKCLGEGTDKTDRSPFVSFVSALPDTFSKNSFIDLAATEVYLVQTRCELEAELKVVTEQYEACLKVRQSPEYKTFSEITLKHEAQAFARMERKRAELYRQLSSLTPRGN